MDTTTLKRTATPLIPFNKPSFAGKELAYIAEAITRGNLSGDGYFTQCCSELLQQRLGIAKVLLTPSCTAALEMSVMLCGAGPGDEVILPSFTFTSTANAVIRAGAKPVFVDIRPDTLNIDESLVEERITPQTKAIFVVHYAGVGCEMDAILDIARRRGVKVIEDAAHGVNAFYRGRSLGSLGTLGAFSFHETKNYISGQGGALCVNDAELCERADYIRDRGTNRKQFSKGLVDKYTWVDVGSAFAPSELTCAFLLGQLEHLDSILDRRRAAWEFYLKRLGRLAGTGRITLPVVPTHCASSYHLFHIVLRSAVESERLRKHLLERGVQAVTHYVPLHTSPMGRTFGYREGTLPVTEDLSLRLLRLPLFTSINPAEQEFVCGCIEEGLGS